MFSNSLGYVMIDLEFALELLGLIDQGDHSMKEIWHYVTSYGRPLDNGGEQDG